MYTAYSIHCISHTLLNTAYRIESKSATYTPAITVYMYNIIYIKLYIYLSVDLSISLSLYICMYYVCMYVCMHVCMYVCMYACMHDSSPKTPVVSIARETKEMGDRELLVLV